MSVGRNAPCPCGSGKKYKSCCFAADQQASSARRSPFVAALGASGPAGRDDAAVEPEWEADVVPLATGIGDDLQARPAVVVVAAGPVVLHVDVIGRAPAEADAVAEAIERGVTEAARRTNQLPEAVRVRHAEVADPLGRALAPRDIAVRTTRELPTIDDFLREGGERIGVGPGGLTMSAPATWAGWGLPEPVVAELFRAAAAYWRAAPWRPVTNVDVIELEMPDGRRWTACVLGNGGEEFGVALYSGIEDFLAHAFADHPVEGFHALRGPLLSITYEERSELPRPMRKEIASAGWEVAATDAYPVLMAFNTPAGGVTRTQADDLIAALRAIPPFVDRFRDAFIGTAPLPAAWTDPETGVRLEHAGAVVPAGESLVLEPPDSLAPGLPEGPGAAPDAALDAPEDIDRFRDAELGTVDRFGERLAAQGLSEATVSRHTANAGVFVDFLAWYQAVPVRAVTELDLRVFLYDWYPRKVHDARTRALAVPTSLRRFFAYLADEEGIVAPWSDPILRDRESFEIRLDEFPGGFWWDEGVSEWRAEAYHDLDARAMLPDREMAGGGQWGPTMGPDEAALEHELGRRWLLWRDEVVRGGVTDPEAVRAEVVKRQRAWEKAPHPRFGGKSPVAVVKRERKARRT